MLLLPPVTWCLAIKHQFINLIWQISTMASFTPSYKIYQLNTCQALPFTSPSSDTETDFYFGHWINTDVKLQLKKLGVMPPEQPLPVKCNRIYQIMWANNGDAISRQYAGTAALKVRESLTCPQECLVLTGLRALKTLGYLRAHPVFCVVLFWRDEALQWENVLCHTQRRAECSLHFTCILFSSCLGQSTTQLRVWEIC